MLSSKSMIMFRGLDIHCVEVPITYVTSYRIALSYPIDVIKHTFVKKSSDIHCTLTNSSNCFVDNVTQIATWTTTLSYNEATRSFFFAAYWQPFIIRHTVRGRTLYLLGVFGSGNCSRRRIWGQQSWYNHMASVGCGEFETWFECEFS